jgi:hypothetical protein
MHKENSLADAPCAGAHKEKSIGKDDVPGVVEGLRRGWPRSAGQGIAAEAIALLT